MVDVLRRFYSAEICTDPHDLSKRYRIRWQPAWIDESVPEHTFLAVGWEKNLPVGVGEQTGTRLPLGPIIGPGNGLATSGVCGTDSEWLGGTSRPDVAINPDSGLPECCVPLGATPVCSSVWACDGLVSTPELAVSVWDADSLRAGGPYDAPAISVWSALHTVEGETRDEAAVSVWSALHTVEAEARDEAAVSVWSALHTVEGETRDEAAVTVWDATADYVEDADVLPGTIVQFGGSSLPAGWLDCDGSAVSRTTYAALFSAIGTTWGAGNGTTTFNLPDLRGRSAVGVGTGTGLTTRALAATGGEEGHLLTTTEIPAHAHPINYSANALTPGGLRLQGTTGALTGTINSNNAGGGGSHNTMHPFGCVYFIIKT